MQVCNFVFFQSSSVDFSVRVLGSMRFDFVECAGEGRKGVEGRGRLLVQGLVVGRQDLPGL